MSKIIIFLSSILISGCASNLRSVPPLIPSDQIFCGYLKDKNIAVRQFISNDKFGLFETSPIELISSLQTIFSFKSVNIYSKKYLHGRRTQEEFASFSDFDYLFDFQFEERNHLSMRNFFSGITLFLIPNKEMSTRALTIKIWDKNKSLVYTNKSINEYEYQISLFPYHGNTMSEHSMHINIQKDLILKTLGSKCD